MPPSTQRRRSIALMILAPVLWSIAGVFTRHIESANRWEVTFYRSLFCALSIAVILGFSQKGLWRSLKSLGKIGCLSGAFWGVMFTGFMLALTLTSTANTLAISSLTPLSAALFSWWLIGQRVSRKTLTAIIIAILGVAVMVSSGLGTGQWLGNLVALCVPLAAGLNWTLIRKYHATVDLIPAILMGGIISALLTLPLALPGTASEADIGILSLLGIFQLAIPCVLATISAKHLESAEITLLGMLENVLGPLWTWLWANETPASASLIGAAIVLSAMAYEIFGEWQLEKNPCHEQKQG